MDGLTAAMTVWSAGRGGSPEAQRLRVRILDGLRAEIESIERMQPRGNTTLKLCHAEGQIKKAFLQDREL